MAHSYAAIALQFLALFMAVFTTVTIASPLPLSSSTNVTTSAIEKRVSHVGRGTWFNVGHGNCGQWDVNSSPIIAIAKSFYDSNGGVNCGQWIQIVNKANGKVAYGRTRDSCESCGWNDLDMSPSLFQQLAPLSVGELTISWHFMTKGWQP